MATWRRKINMDHVISSYPLKHKEEIVPFAIRTLEEVYDEAKGQTSNPHRHNFYTVLWVKQGRGVHHVDFKDHPINDNTVYFLQPGQVHQFAPSEKPRGVAILFTDDFLSLYSISRDFFTSLYLFENCDENTPIPLNPGDRHGFEELSYTMFKELESADSYSYEVIGANLKLLLILCHRARTQGNNASSQSMENSLVKDFKLAVEDKFRHHHKVSFYSDALYITANHLNQVIKSAMGMTAKEYIQNRIMLEAKREAYFTRLSSKNIAYELGFEDPAHFSKFFKNCAGESFSSFRNKIHKKYN